tara:strand:- start:192 stop:425 length:234 start_codon:yes stop_codon:yes gene_type:complete
MKNKFKLQIDLNSPSRKKNVKTPDILRKKDYSPMPVDSPNSIKHRVSVIEVEEVSKEVSKEIEQKKQEYKEGKQNHK